MSDESDHEFFRLRQEGKTYISKVFNFGAHNPEEIRNVWMVLEGSDSVLLGEVQGALCLRLTGSKRKTQVTALITQDDKRRKRLSFQTFQSRSGDWYEGYDKHEFTFRDDEFDRLLSFLNQIQFIDLSNRDRFTIQDISTTAGPKAIIDASERGIVERVRGMTEAQRHDFLRDIQNTLTGDEINVLLGRKQGLEEYEHQLAQSAWSEGDWQDFFERQQWVFGYGLDYRIMRQFDREMRVGVGGTDDKNQPMTDFLMSFTDYTVLVEIKKPSTPLFKAKRGGRAGTWEFSSEFMSAVSQVIEQKAEWLSFSQTGEHYNKAGTKKLTARTRNARSILVIGSKEEFARQGNARDAAVMADTFELFRRECSSIDIITYDELLERARFITRSQ
ncbi:MAG: DUF4263 domain-containing protein [Phenylobacterium sp.]|uniref:Shedu immune nuclease family protein n=1 Tax=Phenylobacterium sp. TaxID=1871053 RepID=UPI0025D60638|nr:Shedu immune nuclease family protein [Phenylobacterium sp.]MBA4011358.1 DUF4263 domain-containing protein [Phenylobacterium sp.]